MDREFLDLYHRELQLLYEQAREFADEYPGIAERLGGLVTARMDPMVAGLLEGTAFLAARVQRKLKHGVPEFTGNLLAQRGAPRSSGPAPTRRGSTGAAARADPSSTRPIASSTATSRAAIG